MKILTWPTPNFGDRLNELVWPAFIPHHLDDDPSHLLVGIGSLLNHRLPRLPTKWIFGSGVGHGDLPTVDATWKILWVRGPRSAAALGIPGCRPITDGAALLADIYHPPEEKHYPVSFIPHCSLVDYGALDQVAEVCQAIGMNLINPHWPVERVLREIWQSERIITEALHGAIVADAFRIPWQPVTRSGVFSFKWLDWTESMGLEYRPALLPYRPQWLSPMPHRRLSRRLAFRVLKPGAKALLGSRLRQLAEREDWQMSRDNVLAGKLGEMKDCLAGLSRLNLKTG